jgi:hypothetical protein
VPEEHEEIVRFDQELLLMTETDFYKKLVGYHKQSRSKPNVAEFPKDISEVEIFPGLKFRDKYGPKTEPTIYTLENPRTAVRKETTLVIWEISWAVKEIRKSTEDSEPNIKSYFKNGCWIVVE